MRRIGREAALDLRGNLARAALSAIGLILAVLAIIAIYVTGSIARQVVIANSEQRYGRHVTVAADLDLSTVTPARLDECIATANRFLQARGSQYALSVAAGTVTSARPTTSPAELTFLAGNIDHVRRVPLLQGTWFSAGIYPGGLVVNQAAAHTFGGLGTTLRVRPDSSQGAYPQQIVGIVADGTNQPDVYASLTQALAFRPQTMLGQVLTIAVHSPSANVNALLDQVVAFSQALGIDPGSTDPREADQVDQVAGDVDTLQHAFLLVAGVALVVAIVGLVNIGLATVAQRARELTIRRAIGATRARIVVLVMASCAAIGVTAAAAAIACGQLAMATIVPHVLSRALELSPPGFPWRAAQWSFLLALTGALASGVIPAVKATRLDLAFALRE